MCKSSLKWVKYKDISCKIPMPELLSKVLLFVQTLYGDLLILTYLRNIMCSIDDIYESFIWTICVLFLVFALSNLTTRYTPANPFKSNWQSLQNSASWLALSEFLCTGQFQIRRRNRNRLYSGHRNTEKNRWTLFVHLCKIGHGHKHLAFRDGNSTLLHIILRVCACIKLC